MEKEKAHVVTGGLKLKKGDLFKKKKKKMDFKEVDLTIKKDGAAGASKMTEAERKFKERQDKNMFERLQKKAAVSHREKVEEFNKQMGELTEFNDIPKESSTPAQAQRGDLQGQVEGQVAKPKRRAVFDSDARNVPISLNFPNKKGQADYNPSASIEELVRDGPDIMRAQTKMLIKETKEIFKNAEPGRVEFLEDIGHVRQDEARIEYTFDSDEALSLWHTGCDSDFSEGFSTVKWERTDQGTAIFSGNLSSQLMRTGKVERAGWASIKLEQRRSFNRKKFFDRWRNFSHLLVKCRGDGRSYKVMLHAPMTIDVSWGDSWSFPLHTHGGPYWQYERIPFSKFFHTVAGRIQDKQIPIHLPNVSSLGIVLMDRVDGPFRLELEFIGVVKDWTHREKFAYETYVIPMWNTAGM
ncbi:unnamed protein product, partial [Mesorhabditis spiculigera]